MPSSDERNAFIDEISDKELRLRNNGTRQFALRERRKLGILNLAAAEPKVTSSAKSGKLAHLQALRGIAATLVVFAHSCETVGRVSGSRLQFLGYLGYVGVAIFFVISGFIIFRTSKYSFGTGTGAIEFIIKRFIRIFQI